VGELVVRAATVDDGGRIGQITVDGWRWAYAGILNRETLDALDPRARGDWWAAWIAEGSPGGTTLVADRDGTVVGFVNHGRSQDPGAAATTGEVRAIYVDPAVHGTGVGAALMNRALADLAGQGYRDATLWVFEANPIGRDFYARGGWWPDGATKEETFGTSQGRVEIRLRRLLP
jgi:GNAT superfamily N-acetyltransferase